jgi:hypothetical protein
MRSKYRGVTREETHSILNMSRVIFMRLQEFARYIVLHIVSHPVLHVRRKSAVYPAYMILVLSGGSLFCIMSVSNTITDMAYRTRYDPEVQGIHTSNAALRLSDVAIVRGADSTPPS